MKFDLPGDVKDLWCQRIMNWAGESCGTFFWMYLIQCCKVYFLNKILDSTVESEEKQVKFQNEWFMQHPTRHEIFRKRLRNRCGQFAKHNPVWLKMYLVCHKNWDGEKCFFPPGLIRSAFKKHTCFFVLFLIITFFLANTFKKCFLVLFWGQKCAFSVECPIFQGKHHYSVRF